MNLEKLLCLLGVGSLLGIAGCSARSAAQSVALAKSASTPVEPFASVTPLPPYPTFAPKAAKPDVNLTDSSVLATFDADAPIIVLVNRSGRSLRYAECDIDKYYPSVQTSLIISHGKGALANGKQKIIVPYIRPGGTVRFLYEIESPHVASWNSRGELMAGVPMVLTVQPNGKVTVNKPYQSAF